MRTNSIYRFIANILVISLMLVANGTMLTAQAFNEEEITARDYVPSNGNVAENDILPTGLQTFRFINNPRYGNIAWIDTLGTFSYLVDPNNIRLFARDSVWANRRDTAIYEVCIANFCDTALIPIWLSHQNDNPTPLPDNFYVEEGQSRFINFGINDTDPDSISDPVSNQLYWFYYTSPNNGVISNFSIDGNAVYTPNPGFTGTDNFLYEVQDHCGLFAFTSITITTTGNNDNPTANSINLVNVLEETISNYPIGDAVTDPENDPLSFAIVEQPNNGYAWINDSGIVSYMPSNNFIGPDTLYYEVTDLVGQTDTAAITLNVVNANNDEPLAPQQSFSTSEDLELNTSIAFEDVIDGDVLTYSIVNNPLNGTASISSTGTLLYTPYLNYVGEDELTYRSCDAGNLCSTASITIQINPVNDSPIAADDTNELPINGSLTGGLQTNVTDIDSPINAMTYSLIEPVSNGNILLEPNGTYSYTPNEYFYGNDSFTYSVCDNDGACTTGNVFITVTLINLPPETENTNWTINEDEETTLSLEEATFDFGNSDLVYSVIESSAIGSFSNITNVGLHFQPLENLNGNFIITFEVCDTGNLCDTAEIDLNILPINDTPTAFNSSFNGTEDEVLNWQAQYTDIESEVLQLSILQAPAHGSIESNSYIPDIDFFGFDSLAFEVCDEFGSCATGVVFITIAPINDSPIALEDFVTGSEDNPLSASIATNDSDIDSSDLVYAAVAENNPSNISIDADGLLYWLPPANFSGYTTVSYSVCDLNGACDTAEVQIQIEEINDAPLVNFPPLLILEDSDAQYTANYYVFDIEGQVLYQSLVTAQGVNVALDPTTGFLSISAVSNYFGNAFVVINTCDVLGACTADTVFMNVEPVNDPPFGFDFTFNTFQNTPLTDSWYNHVFDIDDTVISFSAVSSFGSVSIENDGAFAYSPLQNFLGQDTIWLEACDSSSACISLQFLIDVLPPNQPPSVEDALRSICQGSFAEIDLEELATDEVDSAGNLQYTFTSSVTSSYTIDAAAQSLIITPSSFFAGEMIVAFQVCDNESPSLCSNGTITLNITASTSPAIIAVTVNNISCFGQNDGSIIIEQVSDEAGVLFLWDNTSSDSALYNLSAGAYNVELTGLSSCSSPSIAQFIVTEPEALTLQLVSSSINSPDGGLISSTVTGGTPPFNYLWTGPDNFNASAPSIENLNNAGQYYLTVTDANGCTVDSAVMVTSVESIDFENFNVFPNPSNGQNITVQLPSIAETGAILRITDTKGILVYETTVSSRNEVLKIDSLSPGIYFIIASGGLHKYYARITITH